MVRVRTGVAKLSHPGRPQTSPLSVCEMKLMPPPGTLRPRNNKRASLRPGLGLSCPCLCPQSFSGISYYYYVDAEAQKREKIFFFFYLDEIFLTVIFDLGNI